MNLLLLEENDFFQDNLAAIKGKRAEHLLKVIKLAVNESCKAGLLNGLIGSATLLEKREDGTLILETNFNQAPPPALPIILVVAMQRPNTFDKILHSATVMGVKHIIFIGSRKVEKSYWQSSVLQDEAIKKTILLALEQAVDTVMPKLEFHQKFKIFVEDILPTLTEQNIGICAHPNGDLKISDFKGNSALLMIGPEGGFTDYEIDLIEKANCKTYSMGKRIMRSEFAVTALLAKLEEKIL